MLKKLLTFSLIFGILIQPSLVHAASKGATVTTNQKPESIYFLLVDRFAIGSNPLNSNLPGIDPTSPTYFHGGNLAGVTQELPYIKSMGFNAIWINPIVGQGPVHSNAAGYHGYWGVNFDDVDPHFGSQADFKMLVATAHQMGIKVILDIVVNHTDDIIQYDSAGKAFIPQGLEKIKSPAWLNDLNNYHNVGNIGSNPKATQYAGDFYGLDDIKTEDPTVRKYLTDLWISWINKYKFDGFRIDTAQYVEPGFWNYFIPRVLSAAKKAGIPDFEIFGEVADQSSAYLADYMKKQSFPSVLDFPFQKAISDFVTNFDAAQELALVINNDSVYKSAHSDSTQLRTFISNHDLGRIGHAISNIDNFDSGEVQLKRDLLANDILFLSRGVPITYYGDEVGMIGGGDGTDFNSRQDMFPTQVSAYQNETRIAANPIGNQSSFDQANPIRDRITFLNKLREQYPVLAFGDQSVLYAQNNSVVFERNYGKHKAITMFNSWEKPDSINFALPAGQWSQIVGSHLQVKKVKGRVQLTLPAFSASVFVLK